MAKKNQNTNVENTNTQENNVPESVIGSVKKGKDILFCDIDGNDIMVNYDDIPEMEKRIRADAFKSFADATSFNDACMIGKWNVPYIGMHDIDDAHDSEYLTVFYRESGINFKRFVAEKYGKEMLKELSKKYQKEIRICNAFLNHIALDKEKIDVSDVKNALNTLNTEELHINLKCVDDNDNEYVLTCTNKMVRVKLVNDAKENADVSGFKSVKITDMISVIVSGLSKTYHARNDK